MRTAWVPLLALWLQDSRPESRPAPVSLADLVRTLETVRTARRARPDAVGDCLRAAVTQTTRVPQLARPVVSRGTLWFAPPDRFRLEIHEPRPSCLVLEGGSFAAFRGAESSPQATGSGGVVSIEMTELMRLPQDPGRLQVIAAQRSVTGTVSDDLIEIRIEPREREPGLFQRFRAFLLRIDRRRGDPFSLTLVGREQDSTEYALQGVTWHAELPAALFRTDRLEPAPPASRPDSRR